MLNKLLVEKELGSTGAKICAIDATFLKKSGKCTEGLGMFWNGSLGKSAKVLEISTVAVMDVESNTAYGLSSKLTEEEKDNSKSIPVPVQKVMKAWHDRNENSLQAENLALLKI
jgi:hypothetical protein